MDEGWSLKKLKEDFAVLGNAHRLTQQQDKMIAPGVMRGSW
jgi:hypothetical protein